MPTVGLGLWKIPNEKAADVTYSAIEAGYRLLDSACDYGNEKESGEGIRRAIDAGIVKREELFVVSKLWNTFHRPENVKIGLQKTLADMGLEYLDLYLIHFPCPMKFVPIETRYPPDSSEFDEEVTYQQTWEAMESLVDEGLVKHIGFSNVGKTLIEQVFSYAKVKPSVIQNEMHPYLSQEELLKASKGAGLVPMAYSPFGSLSYVELGDATAEESVLELSAVKDIAIKHSKTPGQIVLRWGVQRGTTVIPKTSKKERLAENLAIFDFVLSEEEMAAISSLNKDKRYCDASTWGTDYEAVIKPHFNPYVD